MSKDAEPKHARYQGGPHNVGDPNDFTLRHVEEHVFITQLVKNRANHEKCQPVIKKWGECMEENSVDFFKGLLTWITCRPQVNAMNDCLLHYYTDTAFRDECRKIYLEKRKRFRETGVIEPDPYYKKPYYESARKKEFLEEFRARKQQQSSESSS